MAHVFERDVAKEVANVAFGLGYKATLEPSNMPSQNSWTNNLASMVSGRKHRPDVLIENGSDFVIVEVKSHPVLLGGITQTKGYADHFDSTVVLCVPDDSFHRTPASVKNYARVQDVRLCPVSGVGRVLKELLG